MTTTADSRAQFDRRDAMERAGLNATRDRRARGSVPPRRAGTPDGTSEHLTHGPTRADSSATAHQPMTGER